MRTKPLILEMCFTTTTEEDSECEEQPVTPHLEEDGTSLLISCSQCSVRVHTSQYKHTLGLSIICDTACVYMIKPWLIFLFLCVTSIETYHRITCTD